MIFSECLRVPSFSESSYEGVSKRGRITPDYELQPNVIGERSSHRCTGMACEARGMPATSPRLTASSRRISPTGTKAPVSRRTGGIGACASICRRVSDYAYSTDLDLHRKALDVLGEPTSRSCLFTPSGTSSTGNMVAYLEEYRGGLDWRHQAILFRCRGIRSLLRPRSSGFLGSKRYTGAYHLPSARKLIQSGCDAVWLTSPVYGTSVYFREAEITPGLKS